MKYKILLILCLFTFLNSFSQEIFIPYRDGNLWGVSNSLGKIIIEPIYESVEFSTDYEATQDFLYTKKGNKKGLIINGKIVFESIYDRLYQNNNLIFTSRIENNIKVSDVFDHEGNSVLKNPVIEIISNKKISDNILIFHLLNNDNTETFYIYDVLNKKIIKTLYENYYSINFIKEQSDYFSTSFLVKKNENDPLVAEAWDMTKLPNEITKTKLLHRTENEYLEKFIENSYKNRDNHYSEVGMGSGNGVGSYDDITGYPDVPLVVEASMESNKPISKTINVNQNFKTKDGKIVLTRNIQNKKPIETILDLKIPISDIEIKNFSSSFKTNDTIFYYSNFIQYKKNKKQGLFFQLNNKIEFDTIAKNVYSISDYKNDKREIIFLVGNKDKKTNKLKYSLFSNIKGLLFPMQFDNLTVAQKLYSSDGNTSFISKIGSKYGIIQIDGTEFLKTEYDEIYENKNYNYDEERTAKKIANLKKADKYGVVYQNTQNYKLEIIDTFFNYEIQSIMLNFPKLKYQKKESSISKNLEKTTLISLKNKEGKLVGYANANGTLYFKN